MGGGISGDFNLHQDQDQIFQVNFIILILIKIFYTEHLVLCLPEVQVMVLIIIEVDIIILASILEE